MVVARSLSAKVQKQPISLLPTKRERISKKRKDGCTDNAGPAWFHMPAAPKTAQMQEDLKMISLRSALDPKRHYKKNAKIATTPYYQGGTIINDATGYHADRLSKRQRGKTILDTLIKDSARQQYLKNKYDALQANRQAIGRSHKHNNKFRKKPAK